MRDLLIGIDIGTTAVKGTMIDTAGNMLAEASHGHDLICAQPDWAEEDPADWWAGTLAVLRALAARQREYGGIVRAISTSGMVPALVLLDATGKPLRPSIQQNDARCQAEILRLRERLDEEWLFARTGGIVSQQTIPPRLLWLQRHEPGVWARVAHLAGSYDYVTYLLTGRLTIERNWALESGMLDVRQGSWLPEVLAEANLAPERLPPVVAPGEYAGHLRPELAAELGLPPRTAVGAGCADHVASAFSAGVREDGDVLLKFGGAGDILIASDALCSDKRIFLDYHLVPGKFLLNGCMASSGSLVKWFANSLVAAPDGDRAFARLDGLAAALPPGADGLITLPYFLGEKTPLMDPVARGLVFGLSLHHRAEHVYRSILEAVGFGFYHHVEVFAESGLAGRRYFVSNGGSRSPLWRQIVCDIIGAPLDYVAKHPGSSLGAAFIAGLTCRVFASWDEIDRFAAARERVTPDMARNRVYRRYFALYKELYQRLGPVYGKLNEVRLSVPSLLEEM